jgi:hypothetical protein
VNEHDRKYVENFFSDISAWSDACNSVAVSYVAFRNGDDYVLAKARLFIQMWPREIERTVFNFDSLQAGVFDLNELDMVPEAFIEGLEKGTFSTPEAALPFHPKEHGSYSAYYNPYMNEGLEAGNRISLLSIIGGRLPNQPRNVELDWELKSGEVPFDSVNELLQELQLGALNSDSTEVELVAFNCLQPEFREPYGVIEGTRAQPAILLAKGLNKATATLGYRVFHQGRVIRRERIEGRDLEWVEVENGWQGSKGVSLSEGAVLQCFGSYAGKAQFQWWLNDPSTVQNPLRAAYSTFDGGLEVLDDFLESAQRKGRNARDLETAIAWLLWMLGFRVAHLGVTPKTQEAPDLIATTAQGHFLVIECTTGILKADNKLPLLVERTETLRKSLEASGSHHLRVLPVIVTTKTRSDVAADMEQAEKLGVLVITKDGIQSLRNQTQLLPDAENLYVAAERTMIEAQEKHSPEKPF